MINRKLILGLGAALILASCSTTKDIHKVAVPEGSATAVMIPAKKGSMTTEEIQKWPHADISTDSIPGMSLEKAYQFVADKKGTTVIVGVIDSGIDIGHEDLKDNTWTNSDEIAGNGKDDDKNGYIDDMHGWNFLGGNGVATPE
ncbi:MAG: S8 family serine peptidase, partial [Flavobacteriaceae bacterium]|nr:S8 family serine peptidase [Flavobacteriaceae bacterium]